MACSCGDEPTGWTDERSFVAAPNTTAQRTTRVAVFGDLGNVPLGNSMQVRVRTLAVC
jgi:hypothetical protein